MTIFTSQFDRARRFSRAYAGETGETRFRTPAKIAVAGVGAGAAALIAADAATDDAPSEGAAWGEGWDDGWDDGDGDGDGASSTGEGADGGPWSYHSDYTGASVGGDGDFLYFSDGDTSFTVG